jgi:hypothetical protein
MLAKRPNPLRGFRCFQCGRPLDDRNNWDLKREKFYCNVLCREADEYLSQEPGPMLVQKISAN